MVFVMQKEQYQMNGSGACSYPRCECMHRPEECGFAKLGVQEWTPALELAKQVIAYLEEDNTNKAVDVRRLAYRVQQQEEMKLWQL